MKPKALKERTDEQLKQIIKECLNEKKRRVLEIKAVSETLRKLKSEYYQYWDAVREAKEILGSRRGGHCPALKADKTSYGGSMIICKAKRYKYQCYGREEMYRTHCFACHLTPEEAKTAMMFDRILIGKREDGR